MRFGRAFHDATPRRSPIEVLCLEGVDAPMVIVVTAMADARRLPEIHDGWPDA
jgi:hypothetical protein